MVNETEPSQFWHSHYKTIRPFRSFSSRAVKDTIRSGQWFFVLLYFLFFPRPFASTKHFENNFQYHKWRHGFEELQSEQKQLWEAFSWFPNVRPSFLSFFSQSCFLLSFDICSSLFVIAVVHRHFLCIFPSLTFHKSCSGNTISLGQRFSLHNSAVFSTAGKNHQRHKWGYDLKHWNLSRSSFGKHLVTFWSGRFTHSYTFIASSELFSGNPMSRLSGYKTQTGLFWIVLGHAVWLGRFCCFWLLSMGLFNEQLRSSHEKLRKLEPFIIPTFSV